MIDAERERPRPGSGEGFTDAVTFAFADAEAELFGSARLGLAPEGETASALAVLFAGREAVVVHAQGGVEITEADWADIEVAGLRARIGEPLQRWSVDFEHDDGAFALSFTALAPSFEFGVDTAVARTGGMEGYEHFCRVEGEVSVAGRSRPVTCLGQRGHAWGTPDWDAIERATSVSVWLSEDRAIALQAVMPAGAQGHDAEAVSAVLLDAGEEGPVVHPVSEPRLSTTYDAEGHHRRAGLELWLEEDDSGFPRRAAGGVLCGTTLQLGRLRMDNAFFEWTMDGEHGLGRYEILRRA
jgi:hypothetical protein